MIRRTTGADPTFIALTRKLDDELRATYGDVQDQYAPFNVVETDTAVVAYVDGVAVGCGCFKPFDTGDPSEHAVELKRMFVGYKARGTGVGRAILRELEAWAKERGARAIVLETGTEQAAAIALYERSGYARIPLYGQYVGMKYSICMQKQLP